MTFHPASPDGVYYLCMELPSVWFIDGDRLGHIYLEFLFLLVIDR